MDASVIEALHKSRFGKLHYNANEDISFLFNRLSVQTRQPTSGASRNRKSLESHAAAAQTQTEFIPNSFAGKVEHVLNPDRDRNWCSETRRRRNMASVKQQYEDKLKYQLEVEQKKFEDFDAEQARALQFRYKEVQDGKNFLYAEKINADKKHLEAEAQKRLQTEVERRHNEDIERAALELEKQRQQERLDKAAEEKSVELAKLELERRKEAEAKAKREAEEREVIALQINLGKAKLKEMLEIIEADQKFHQEVLSKVKAEAGTFDSLSSLLQGAKHSLQNMCILVQHSHQLIGRNPHSISQELEKLKAHSAHLNKSLKAVDEIIEKSERGKQQVQPSTNIQIIDTVSESCPEVSSDELDVIFAFHEALKKSSSPQCKLFLKTVKGGCNVIKNSLSANMDNLKLHRDNVIALFGGQTVTVADNFAVNPAALNNGVEITRLVLAETVVCGLNQFDKRELAMASLLVELAAADPSFRNILLAVFHRKCPFTRPIFLSRKGKQSEDSFKEDLGYLKQLGEWEDPKTYLNRVLYTVQLYSAVLTCRPMSGSIQIHPYGYKLAWQWLATFVNTPPFSDFAAGILREFLSVCGRDLLRQYGVQFEKLMRVVNDEYLKRCREVGDDTTFVGALENSLTDYFDTGHFFQDFSLDAQFWEHY